MQRALNYNEQKVQKGKAECLFAGNFLQEANELNFYQKLHRFEQLIEQNFSKTNTLHISLNFHPSEKVEKEKLVQIATSYMDKIGFGEQPFLVYRHFDAGHPHLHIVTTTIKEDGKRIDTYNIGRNQSQKARKEIEDAYGLMQAEGRQNKNQEKDIYVQRARYGLTETKKSITNILSQVIDQYNYTSVAELNAVLQLYNVMADGGSKESRTYRNRGLHYRLLDEKGNKIGVPIKASSIYFRPTLKYLEEKFCKNNSLRLPFKSKLKTAIDWALSRKPASLDALAYELKKEKVSIITRKNDQGFVYGMTFIDHRTKTVFNGSDLGKMYSAAGIKERLLTVSREAEHSTPNLLEKPTRPSTIFQKQDTENKHSREAKEDYTQKQFELTNKKNLLELLIGAEQTDNRTPFGFIKKKKKRRKPRL